MSKKIIIAIIGGLVLVGLIIMIKSSLGNKKKPISNLIGENQEELSPTPQYSFKLKEYNDPSGFKFSYPEDTTVNSKDIVDENVYSDLEISSKKLTGRISIKALTTELSSISDWLKENKIYPNNAVIKDIKLADLAAKSIKKDNKLYTVALDQYQTLFVIQTDSSENEKFWSDANEVVVSTLAFVAPASAIQDNSSSSSVSDGGGEDVIFEGEEEIE